MPARSVMRLVEQLRQMKSGGGVLLVGLLQLCIGLVLLGTYEGFKVAEAKRTKIVPAAAGSGLAFNTLTPVFLLSIINNVFAVLGLIGVLAQQRWMVTAFFSSSAVALVGTFHLFVDVCTDINIRRQSDEGIRPYEKAAASFIFFSFCLHLLAVFFALKAIEELKLKSREEYSKVGVLSDTLQFELDH